MAATTGGPNTNTIPSHTKVTDSQRPIAEARYFGKVITTNYPTVILKLVAHYDQVLVLLFGLGIAALICPGGGQQNVSGGSTAVGRVATPAIVTVPILFYCRRLRKS